MSSSWHQLVNGTAVAIDGQAVLLTGASGSGKSDLALRLIAEGAALTWTDVAYDPNDNAIKVRREMEAAFARPNVGAEPVA